MTADVQYRNLVEPNKSCLQQSETSINRVGHQHHARTYQQMYKKPDHTADTANLKCNTRLSHIGCICCVIRLFTHLLFSPCMKHFTYAG